MDLISASWFFVSILLSIPFAVIAGYIYGKLLNAVKGSEMTIATFTGFSIVALMSIVWLIVPFNNPKMGWFIGKGLRETIQLDAVGGAQILNNFLMFKIGDVMFPTGMFLVFGFLSVIVWLFFRSKTGIAISAGGINPKFAQAAGLNIDRNRIWANVLSTVLGAIGIIIYAQSFGYAQLYLAPLLMAFPAVAAILVGGATAARASVLNVVIGVFLLQGLFTTALPVANEIFRGTDLSEIMRMLIQNGIILYALTQVKRRA
jgi:simple sugar transport system permease protein